MLQVAPLRPRVKPDNMFLSQPYWLESCDSRCKLKSYLCLSNTVVKGHCELKGEQIRGWEYVQGQLSKKVRLCGEDSGSISGPPQPLPSTTNTLQ